MSVEYKEETRLKTEKKTEALLEKAPTYVAAFYQYMRGGHREMLTIFAYMQDVMDFLSYEKEMLPKLLSGKEVKDIPERILSGLTPKDLLEYREYLRKVRMISRSSAKRKLSALSVFFQFLQAEGIVERNPMDDLDYPRETRHRIIRLDSDLSIKLLSGVLANNKYLLVTGKGADEIERVIDIPEEIRIRRERLVLRNYAILRLFLGAGLRVSELVGLDLGDIHFSRSSVTVISKGGDETEVFFNDSVSDALRTYLNGMELPLDIFSSYGENSEQYIRFVRKNFLSPSFRELSEKEFGKDDPDLLEKLRLLSEAMRRDGRAALGPKKGCNAVFITTRGDRMSVRAVELMVKEMVKTYLPDYDDKEIFSPHKLRATCATRILKQTGNIALAARQLNHKGVQVTAAFYAELQKEDLKEEIGKLSVDQW